MMMRYIATLVVLLFLKPHQPTKAVNAAFSVIYEVQFEDIDNIVPDGITEKMKRTASKIYRREQINADNSTIELLTSVDDGFVLKVDNGMSRSDSHTQKSHISFIGIREYLYGSNGEVSYSFTSSEPFITKYDLCNVVQFKITAENKNIAGFKCFKAIPEFLDNEEGGFSSTPQEIWFTPEIQSYGGPTRYTNLPGVILEVKSKNATITATSVKAVKGSIKIPSFPDKKIISHSEARAYHKKIGEAIESRMKN
jgi:GLPGLI family protein